MIKVKHFICGASHASLEYFDEDVNKWMKKNKVTDIKRVNEFYGQSPVGMSGHQENVLFVALWYVTADEDADDTVSSPSSSEITKAALAS